MKKFIKLFLLSFMLTFNLGVPGITLAEFTVTNPGSFLTDNTMELTGQVNLGLSDKVEEALAKGIPLDIEIEYRLLRVRQLIWNLQLASWQFTHSIQYHALSRQYLIRGRGLDTSKVESFTTLQEALNFMGSLDGLALPLPQELDETLDNKEYVNFQGQVRAKLVIESLPAPLRPVAYTSSDWRLNSGWVTWKITH